jgi:hypothetical protein
MRKKMTNKIRELEKESVELFLKQSIYTDYVEFSVIYDDYVKFALINGFTFVMPSRAFGRLLAKSTLHKPTTKGTIYWFSRGKSSK